MIGEQQVIDHLSNGKGLDGIIIMVGSSRTFKPEDAIDESGVAMLYTGNLRPKVKSLPFLKNQKVQLIDGGGSDASFASWYSIIVDSDPAYLVALDSEGEIYVG